MSQATEESEIDLRPAINFLGLDRVIEQVGLDRVIEQVGLDRVVRTIGMDRLVTSLTAAQRRELKRRLR